MKDLNSAVAEELRALKGRHKGVRYEDIALATGLSKSTVIRYLDGARGIPLDALDEIARALGDSPTEVLWRATAALGKAADAELAQRAGSLGLGDVIEHTDDRHELDGTADAG